MTRNPRRLLGASLAAAAVLSVAGMTVPADAATPVNQTGKVTHVDDGDTVDVDLAGDGTSTPQRIRMTGINAMELTTYSSYPDRWQGECHAVDAAKRLYALVYGKTVRVTAQDKASMSGNRYRRTISVYVNGAWRDVSQMLLAEGHGLFLGNGQEYGVNKADAAAAQYGAKQAKRLWDTDYCGSGPYQAAALRVAVNYDAAGNDGTNVNGEFIRISNASAYAVPINGWWVRDSAYRGTLAHGYVFPSGARVPANGSITVFVGKGTNPSTKFYWGNTAPIFENPSGSPTYYGDGAYLFDPQGDMRAWQQYPCRYAC